MKYCKECGHEIKNSDQQFCVQCGHPVDSKAASPKVEVASGKKVSPQVPKKKQPMTKKQKRLTIIGAAVAILFIGLYFVGAHFTSVDRLVAKYEEAVSEQDADKLAKILSFSGTNDEIEEEDVEGFLLYLKENPSEATAITKFLRTQMNRIDGKMSQLVSGSQDDSGSNFISIERGEGFLFYETYELAVEPIYATLHTNVDGATLFNGEEELTTSDSTEYHAENGPFLPGIYEFKAEVQTDLVELSTEEQVTLTHSGKDVDLYLDASYITFDIPFQAELENRVLLNGEEVDFDLFSGEELGPVLLDGSMNVSAEVDFPWGTMTTSEQSMEDSVISLSFNLNEGLQEDLKKSLQDYTDSYMTGWEENDFSSLDYVSDDLYESIENDLDVHEYLEDYIYYQQVSSMKLGENTLTVDFIDDQYYLSALIEQDYKSGSNYRNSDGDYDDSYTDMYRYQFIYKDDTWKVYHKESGWYDDLESPVDLGVSTDLVVLGEDYEPSDNEVSQDEMASFMDTYFTTMVESINERDISVSESVLDLEGNSYPEHKDYLGYLEEKGITEEFISVDVVDFEKVEDGYRVTTNEEYNIFYEDNSGKYKSFESTFLVTNKDGKLGVHTLEETDELESKDL
ncbi:zinc ribbon domain-containing protein [Oceanobacillus halophilus]|uniref:Zinc-ribbon domain-containing protein n=1 Tax=Oceanobacillus halophilus TaxID=930130 RepID=A0A494ZTG5_9BACI|nr:hypothetical protein [Oceanobacillus halophilus]RKQ28562.1 hypothetical protein D8M06_18790 [Oceanobacillus halophilus]